jgi:hypothetical protein
MLSIFAEDFTKPRDSGIDAVVTLDDGARWPQPSAQVLSGDQLPGLFQQQRKNFEGLAPQAERYPFFWKLTIPWVGCEWPKPKRAVRKRPAVTLKAGVRIEWQRK